MFATVAMLLTLFSLALLTPAPILAWLVGRRGAAVVLSLAVAVVVMFTALIRFTHPCLDDFVTGWMLRDHGWTRVQVETYRGWSGRFSATALCVLDRLDLTWYRLICLLFLGSLITVLGWLASGMEGLRSQRTALSLLVVALWLQTMPAPAEGLGWLSGMLCYQTGLILDLLALGLLARPGRLPAAAAGVCCFFAAGCSETTAGLLAGPLLVGCAFEMARHPRRPGRWALALGGLACGFGVVALAPGNAIRTQALGGLPACSPVMVYHLITAPLERMGHILAEPLVAMALMSGVAWGWTHGRVIAMPPGALVCGGVLGVVLGCLPADIFIGVLPGRAANTVHLFAIIALMGCAVEIGILLHAAPTRWPRTLAVLRQHASAIGCMLAMGLAMVAFLGDACPWMTIESADRCYAGFAAIFILLLATIWRDRVGRSARQACWAIAVVGSVVCLGFGHLPQACGDLVFRAPAWDRQLTARERWLERNAPLLPAKVRVPSIERERIPSLIAVGDISASSTSWANQAYARWYGIGAIVTDRRLAASAIPIVP